MTSTTAHRLLGLASLGLLAVAPAMAQQPGFHYGSIAAGQSRTDTDPSGLTADPAAQCATRCGSRRSYSFFTTE